jgi:hypothetical protein
MNIFKYILPLNFVDAMGLVFNFSSMVRSWISLWVEVLGTRSFNINTTRVW